MKRVLSAGVLAFFAFTVHSPSVYAKSNGCLSVDGIYSRYVTDNFEHKNGSGGSLQLEWQPIEFFSIGAGADTLLFWGTDTPGITTLESVNLVGRVIFNSGDPFTIYLIGGYGLNPKLDLKSDLQWGGDYRVLGGLGTWAFLSPKVAVDLSVVYDYHHQSLLPPTDSMQAVDARIGLSFFFENAQKNAGIKASVTPTSTPQAAVPTQVVSEAATAVATQAVSQATTPVTTTAAPVTAAPIETPAPKPQAGEQAVGAPSAKEEKSSTEASPVATEQPQSMAPTPVASAPVSQVAPAAQKGSVTTAKGDSLWDTAARPDVYGDPELFPLLIEANKDALQPKQYVLDPDKKLTIITDPTQDMIDKARQEAWSRKYQKYGGRRLTPNGYQRWRKNHGLPNTYKVDPSALLP